MSQDGRALSASVSEAAAGKPASRDGGCATGTFTDQRAERMLAKPLEPAEREGLRRLITAGKMIRRTDGSYGSKRRRLITNAVATRLKSRDLAISGFNREIVPTDKGRRVHAEECQ